MESAEGGVGGSVESKIKRYFASVSRDSRETGAFLPIGIHPLDNHKLIRDIEIVRIDHLEAE